jgi:uncharacterized OB-fold protein
MRSIARAVAIAPAYQLGKLAVPGPDEDAFTLAAAAVEELLGSSAPPADLHLVGDFPSMADGGFRALVGSDRLNLHRYAAGSDGLFQALVTAAQTAQATGSAMVVAAEVVGPLATNARPGFGGGAVAFSLMERGGILPLSSTGPIDAPREEVSRTSLSSHSNDPTPSAQEEKTVGLCLTDGVAASSRSDTNQWEFMSRDLPLWGNAPTIGPAIALERLYRKLSAGAPGQLKVEKRNVTHRLFVQRTGEVAWLGAFSGSARSAMPISEEVWRRSFDRPVRTVSEGAYIPGPRYLENLPSRWRFAATRCAACGTYAMPPRGVCPKCRATEGQIPETLRRSGGTIVASTMIGPGGQPTEFDAQVELTGAYQVVIVELAPGVRVTLQVTDAVVGELTIGGQVDTRLRRLYPMEGEWRYGRKAVPFDAQVDPSLERWKNS